MKQPEKTPSQQNPDSKPGQPFDLEGIPIPEMSLDDLSPSSDKPAAEEPKTVAEEEFTDISFSEFSFEELLKDLGETRAPQPEPTPEDVKPSASEVRLDMLDGLDLPEMQLSESGETPGFSGEVLVPAVATPEESPSFNPADSVPIPELSLDDLVTLPARSVSGVKSAPEPKVPERQSDLSQFDGIELLDVRLDEKPRSGPAAGAEKPVEPEALSVESVPIPEMSFDDLELPQPEPVPVSAPLTPVKLEAPVSTLDFSGLDGVELPEARVFSMGDSPVAMSDVRQERPPDTPKSAPVPADEPVFILEPGMEDLIPGLEIVSDESSPVEGSEIQESGVVIEAPHSTADVSPMRRQSFSNPSQATAAFKSLFAQSDVPGILSLYEAQVDSRVKRLAIDWMVKHVDMLGVNPLLSVGSIETDEEMFRYMMRELLKLDRGKVCKQIEVETCPRPLLQVAVVILSELGLRSALPKLQKCVEVGDTVVRSVALHGIGRSGEAAEPLIPLLLKTVEHDPDKNVRVAAAKALQIMNTRKAYESFEQKAHEVSLDPPVAHVLEELRAKFDPAGENRARLGGARTASKTAEKGSTKAEVKESADPGKAGKLAIVVLIILAAGYFLYKQLMGKG